MATSDKYDRQLRLWGANGQRALSKSRIVLIHATAVGTETVKNLVLPGIGSFHIVDEESQLCDDSSTSVPSNFFALPATASDTSTRACVVCHLLSELNDEVRGSWQTVPSLMDADYALLLQEQQSLNPNDESLLVIAADLPLQPLSRLASTCWDMSIPFMSVKSYGFIGTLRIQTPYHAIVESKPDNSPPDLRLVAVTNHAKISNCSSCTFPELRLLADSIDLTALDDAAHQHVPYVILLIKAMDQWKQHHKTTTLPQTMDQKESFKSTIKAMSRDFYMELNFQEAHRDAYLAYTNRDIPYELQQLLEHATVDNIHTSFDVTVLALKKFLQMYDGCVPLHGSIPDMTSSTDLYVQLQQIYKAKADQDLAHMKEFVQETIEAAVAQNHGLDPTKLHVSEEELSIFCKNIYNLQTLKTRSFDMELRSQQQQRQQQDCPNGNSVLDMNCDEILEDLLMACADPSDPPHHTPLLWYVAVRACELFQADHSIYPGDDSRTLALQSDTEAVWKILGTLVNNMGLHDVDLVKESLTQDHAAQAVSWYNAELHTVASVVGGVASQEAVKLITHQYVPLNNTFVFNGISSIAAVYTF